MDLTLSQTRPCFYMSAGQVFLISLFLIVFSTYLENFPPFPSTIKLLSANFSVWKSLILVSVNLRVQLVARQKVFNPFPNKASSLCVF